MILKATRSPYDPAIPLLGIYPEKTKIRKDTCTPMFTAALFTIAKTWKQPKCPSTEEWIKKMRYIYTMEYYSAMKRNKIGSFVEMWMDLETVIQSEVSQKEKNKYSMLTCIYGICVLSHTLCCVSNNKLCTCFYSFCLLETFLLSMGVRARGTLLLASNP